MLTFHTINQIAHHASSMASLSKEGIQYDGHRHTTQRASHKITLDIACTQTSAWQAGARSAYNIVATCINRGGTRAGRKHASLTKKSIQQDGHIIIIMVQTPPGDLTQNQEITPHASGVASPSTEYIRDGGYIHATQRASETITQR